MKVHVFDVHDLDAELIDDWQRLQQTNPALDSPFFSSAFTRAVAAERRGVRVAVMAEGREVIGFLPYHAAGRVARPVAGSFTDFQGPIVAADTAIHLPRVLRQAGLVAWQFEHLVTKSDHCESHAWAYAESPYMDLSRGFEAYRLERREAGSDELAEALRKARKLEREVAPLVLETDSLNYRVFDQLIAWKREQLAQTRQLDCFRPAWVVPMLARVLHTRGENFRGLMSVLYAGEEIAAVTLGLRSATVLHGWVTVYNRKFSKYSPGLILMAKLAQAAESLGIQRIDMGPGTEAFKHSFASGSTRVAEGAIDRRLVTGMMRHSWMRAKELVRGTSFRMPAQRVVRRLRGAGQWIARAAGAGES